MAPRKAAGPTSSGRGSRTQSTPTVTSQITAPAYSFLKFPAVALASLSLSTVLFSLSTPIIQGNLAWTSKRLDSWWEVTGLISWRLVELGAAWILGYDGEDVAYLISLSHAPTYILLSKFYGIRPATLFIVWFVTSVSTAAPFFLSRQIRWKHKPSSYTWNMSISNAAVLADLQTTFYTSLLAALIYAVALYICFATWLPAHLVTHFDGLPDIRAVHAGSRGFVSLLIQFIPAGCFVREFILVPSAGLSHSADQVIVYAGGRQGEFIITSIYRKTWVSLRAKSKVLLTRTVVLATMTMLNTVIQVWGTINGVELEGAVEWAAIWTGATLLIGSAFSWIQAADGL